MVWLGAKREGIEVVKKKELKDMYEDTANPL